MGRAPCCDKANVKKGPWSPEEDAKLKDFIDKHGTGGNWIALPHKAGLKRCGKSCRLRWLNYLRPNIKHGEFSEEEDRIICTLYANIGSRWSIIASQLPGRTDNDIKNYWNTKLRKKLMALLPSFQKKPSFLPSIPLQQPQPSLIPDHQKTDSFMNASSSFYNNFNSNIMNVYNNINCLHLSTTTSTNNHVPSHTNITDLFHNYSTNNIMNVSNKYYCPEMKERMLMFGYGAINGGEMSTTCSSEGGASCMSQISYNNEQYPRIKKEDQITLQGFGDNKYHGFMTDLAYVDQKQKGCLIKNLEDVKQLMIGMNSSSTSSSSINVDINSYLMNGDDENKTTHDIITDGFYRMIDGGN